MVATNAPALFRKPFAIGAPTTTKERSALAVNGVDSDGIAVCFCPIHVILVAVTVVKLLLHVALVILCVCCCCC